jgi:hypothetical protein
VTEALIIAIAGVLVQAGILLATVRFLGQRMEEQHKATRVDLNGLGKIGRSIMAETIILAKEHPDFPVIVRKLINGI